MAPCCAQGATFTEPICCCAPAPRAPTRQQNATCTGCTRAATACMRVRACAGRAQLQAHLRVPREDCDVTGPRERRLERGLERLIRLGRRRAHRHARRVGRDGPHLMQREGLGRSRRGVGCCGCALRCGRVVAAVPLMANARGRRAHAVQACDSTCAHQRMRLPPHLLAGACRPGAMLQRPATCDNARARKGVANPRHMRRSQRRWRVGATPASHRQPGP